MSAAQKGSGLLLALCALSVASFAATTDFRIVDAAQKEDRDAVRSLLKEHVDVNAAQADGATAVMWASYRNDPELVDLLMAAGADVNLANDYGITPLWLACANGSGLMVDKLLKAGADANLAQWSGATPLMKCAQTGNTEAVTSLLKHGSRVNAAESGHGQTALMWAAANSHSQIVKALIDAGADVNASTKGGSTALMFAAQQGDVESGRFLLKAGANIDAATNAQSTWVGDTPLLLAAASGHEAMAIFLLDKGADPDSADEFGFTALHFSMMSSLAHVTGARIETILGYLWPTYLHRKDMPELVKALLAHGANPNARITKYLGGNKLLSTRKDDPHKFAVYEVGATPFLVAARAQDIEIMHMLVEAGADPSLATDGGTTPLMMATGLTRQRDFDAMPYTPEQAAKAFEAVKYCVDLGVDVNAANNVGLTALHGAAFTGLDAAIRLLVQKGANIDAKDLSGQTPLQKAMNIKPPGGLDTHRNGHDIFVPYTYHASTVKLLLQLGATPVAPQVVAQEANSAAEAPAKP